MMVRIRLKLSAIYYLIAAAGMLHADKNPVDCGKQSLVDAISKAETGQTIEFSGVCAGPVLIHTGGLTLTGLTGAAIDGRGGIAVSNFARQLIFSSNQ